MRGAGRRRARRPALTGVGPVSAPRRRRPALTGVGPLRPRFARFCLASARVGAPLRHPDPRRHAPQGTP
ncbi:hypothetical protein LT493_05410 [Streptomyces tricolor]|nr:hypothetical protein [Streptomyces tricolor]